MNQLETIGTLVALVCAGMVVWGTAITLWINYEIAKSRRELSPIAESNEDV